MNRRPYSLLTIAEHRERERRARLVRRIVWAVLILGALGVVLIPSGECPHGFSC